MRHIKEILVAGLIAATCVACVENVEAPVETVGTSGRSDEMASQHNDIPTYACIDVSASSGTLPDEPMFRRWINGNGRDVTLATSTGEIYRYDPLQGLYIVVGVIEDLDRFDPGSGRLRLVQDQLCDIEDFAFSPSQRFPVYRIDSTLVGIHDARSDNLGFAYAVTTSQDGLTWSLSSVTSIYPVLFFERDGSYLVVAGTDVWDVTDLANPQITQTLQQALFPPANGFQRPHYEINASPAYVYPLGNWMLARIRLLAEASFQETLYIIDTTDLSIEQFLWDDYDFPSVPLSWIQRTDLGETIVFYPFLPDSQEAIVEIDPNGPSGTVIRTLRGPVDES